MHIALTACAAAAYLIAARLAWTRATASDRRESPRIIKALRAPGGMRLCITAVAGLHGAQLFIAGIATGAVDLALGRFISLIAFVTVALFFIASFARNNLNLGVVVLPLGLIGLLVGALLPGEPFLLHNFARGIGGHIALAIPAYAVLSIALAQAVLLWMQEKQLRKPNPGRFFPALPAMETMETNLFQLTLLGFALLTVNLITGMHNTLQNHGALLLFNHHILFALMAWGGFGALLLGRATRGWRGRVAAKLTVAAFIILALAYFGARFVREWVLG